MINREDMLELTRRMTPARSCFTRIAGAYVDSDGMIEDTFNTRFLNLSGAEKTRNLALAKTVPFSETNVQLQEHRFRPDFMKPGGMYQLLTGILECRLENDALMDVFYEAMADGYPVDSPTAIYVFAGTYDIPVKAADKYRFDESEEIYNFIICTISRLVGEYEPGKPDFGFLYPAFADRSADPARIDIYHRDPDNPERGLLYKLLGERA